MDCHLFILQLQLIAYYTDPNSTWFVYASQEMTITTSVSYDDNKGLFLTHITCQLQDSCLLL